MHPFWLLCVCFYGQSSYQSDFQTFQENKIINNKKLRSRNYSHLDDQLSFFVAPIFKALSCNRKNSYNIISLPQFYEYWYILKFKFLVYKNTEWKYFSICASSYVMYDAKTNEASIHIFTKILLWLQFNLSASFNMYFDGATFHN